MAFTGLERAACALAALALSACSSTDLEAFNAGLEMYNGVTYYDTTDDPQTLNCRSGNGYLVARSGVRSNQQFVYFTSQTNVDVTMTVKDAAGGGTSLYVPARGTSETYWTYPSYDLEYTWAC